MQLPGFGVITAMTVLAAIGEIQRFETAKTSGELFRADTGDWTRVAPSLVQKGITKEGRKELRWAMVEVAQRAVKSDPRWKREFQELQKRMHRNQAIVAIARQSAGTGLVCPDPTPTLSPLQPGTDCLQVSDLGLADG